MKKSTFFETTSVKELAQRGLTDSGGPESAAKGELNATAAFEQLLHDKDADADPYVLRLYIAGMTPKSCRAIANVRALCERNLAGRYQLEIIDVRQTALLPKGEQIVATPTLVKKLPLPLKKLIGDMSDEDRMLVGLDLRSKR